jgi:hypothetical protein
MAIALFVLLLCCEPHEVQGGKTIISTTSSFATSEFGTNDGWASGSSVRFLSDVNGDGKADIVGVESGGAVSVALSNGTWFETAVSECTVLTSLTDYSATPAVMGIYFSANCCYIFNLSKYERVYRIL